MSAVSQKTFTVLPIFNFIVSYLRRLITCYVSAISKKRRGRSLALIGVDRRLVLPEVCGHTFGMAASGGDRRQRTFLTTTRKDPILGTILQFVLFLLTLNVASGQCTCCGEVNCNPDTRPAPEPVPLWLATIWFALASSFSALASHIYWKSWYEVKENEIFNRHSTKVNGQVYLNYTKHHAEHDMATTYHLRLKYEVSHNEELLTVEKVVQVEKKTYDQYMLEQSLVELAVLPERPLSGRPTNGYPKFPVEVHVILPPIWFICSIVFFSFWPYFLAIQATVGTIQEPSTIAWALMGVAIISPIAIQFLVPLTFEPNMEKRLDEYNRDGAVKVGDGTVVNEVMSKDEGG
jgi:hypothetical protein